MNNSETYYIDHNYIPRTKIDHWDDRTHTDKFQDKVYATAKDVATRLQLTSVMDIGTGSAFKLIKYFNEYNTLGLECEPCYSFLKNSYPDKKWMLGDFSQTYGSYELIISSDVIEHLENPNALLEFIIKHSPKAFVISTPMRNNLGPPLNKCHYREWSNYEFKSYLTNMMPGYAISIALIMQRGRYTMCATGIKV